MNTPEKLKKLRDLMREMNVNCLLIPSDDHHQSEYVGDHFKAREYVSGFTGSAGTLVVTDAEAKLFTDGRYFIQAEKQLKGSGIDLMRSGEEGVPTPTEYIVSAMKSGDTLAFDGRCVSALTADKLKKQLPEGAVIKTDADLVGLIWNGRPPLPHSPIYRLESEYAGRSHAEKLAELRAELEKKGCDHTVISSLCDIAWLYNLRGSDVENTPVFLSYCVIGRASDRLYVNREAISAAADALAGEGVELCDYNDFYAELAGLSGKVLIDRPAVNSAICAALSGCETVCESSPVALMKAVKNETELENVRRCHIADGLAVTKLMLELKYGEREFDELTVDKYLLSLRRECAERLGVTLLDESFGAICAFGSNGAIIHYKADAESCAKIDKNAAAPMLMVDSGGQYLEGTTDITRTFVLGGLTPEMKLHYTVVAMGMLRLMSAVFPDGASGSALDSICRMPFWERGLDYRHGTGHGVGYLNSVHEGPNRFHWRTGDAKLVPGMITTDEPGIYIEGSHGIRIENELLCVKGEHNEYGQFLRFENLTFCPIDLDGIDTGAMDKSDIERLNGYNRSVFEKLSPHLCANDRERLAYLTRAI